MIINKFVREYKLRNAIQLLGIHFFISYFLQIEIVIVNPAW